MRRIATATILGIGLVFAYAVSVTAATRTVDRIDDNLNPANGCQAAVPNDCALRGAINGAVAGDTIDFLPSIQSQTIQLDPAGGISISKNNLSIIGPGNIRIVLPNGEASLFFLNANRTGIQISGLILADQPAGNGTSIQVSSNATLTLSNMVFINNRVRSVSIGNGAALDIFNSQFFSNSTAGGTVFAPTGTVSIGGSSIVRISGSTFSSNTGNVGSAVQCLYANVAIINSLFDSNTTTGNGAAINTTGCNTTVVNTTFAGNHSNETGGAIYVGGGGLNIFRHLTVSGNSAGIAAGGIDSIPYPTTDSRLYNSIVSGNTAPSAPNSTLLGSNNIIDDDAGLFPLANYGGPTKTFALKCGSPAINAGDNAFARDLNNFLLTTDQRGGTFARIVDGTVDAGAFEAVRTFVSNNSDDVLTSGSLRKAIADAPGGSSVCFDPAYFNVPRTVAMSDGNLNLNKTLMIEGPGTNLLTLDPNNSSRHFYIHPQAGTVRLSGMTLTRGRENLTDPKYGYGGSILVDSFNAFAVGATADLSNVIITNSGNPDQSSPAIYNGGILSLTDSTIANSPSGGITNEVTKPAIITRSIIRNNFGIQGAGIANFGTMTVTQSTIADNAATPTPGLGSPTIGGGIANYGNLTVLNSTISGNTAHLGGGLYNNRTSSSTGYVYLRNSTIAYNHAIQTGNGSNPNGGGIYIDGNNDGGIFPTIDTLNTTISQNSAANGGGGVFIRQVTGNYAYNNMVSSIVAGNAAPLAPDISGVVISYGYNLIGNTGGFGWAENSPDLTGNVLDPAGGARLGPLGNYGGSTLTFALLPNSPAINGGHPTFFFADDQRGSARPIGINDKGSFERNIAFDQSTVPNGNQNVPYSSQLSVTRSTNLANLQLSPFIYSIITGTLPPGLALDPNTGVISGIPTVQGLFTYTVKATDVDGMAGVSQYAMYIFAPSAANVSVSGRIITADNRGLAGATVSLTDVEGNIRRSRSSSFGYYSFGDIEAGRTYVISVNSKRHVFSPRVITVAEDIAGVDLIAVDTSEVVVRSRP